MPITFEGAPQRITLSSGKTEESAGYVYSRWKDWMTGGAAGATRSGKYPAFRVDGGAPLTSGISQGSYFFLDNGVGWRIRPPEEDITVYMTGSLVPEDSTFPVMAPTIGAFTAAVFGLQPITQSVAELVTIQNDASYGGEVALDTLSGTIGTAYPIGTASEPARTIADAVTIAERLGVKAIRVVQGLAVLGAEPVSGWKAYQFHGNGADVSTWDLGGQDVSSCLFTSCSVSGILGVITGALPRFQDVTFDNTQNFCGTGDNCVLKGNLSLGPGLLFISQCAGFSTSKDAPPIVSYAGLNAQMVLRHFSGTLQITNMAHVQSDLSLHCSPGFLTIEPSCTNGEIYLVGHGKYTNNGTPVIFNTDGFVRALALNSADSISKTILALTLSE